MMHACRRALVVAGTVLLVALLGLEQGRAQVTQVPGGWTALGNVTLDKNGCTGCPATFPTAERWRAFGLGTDTPYAVALSGQAEVVCGDGTSYQVLIKPARRGGLFQVIGNSCVNFESKELRLALTSVSLSPPDADRTVTLTAYGRLR